MPPFAPIIIAITFLTATFCLLSFLLLARRQRTQQRKDSERIVALQCKIETALCDSDKGDKGLGTDREAFRASLKTARLTTELQRPRLENMAKVDKQAPEKYRILGKLASQGMAAEDIAAILSISRVEAGQLLNLSNMAQIGR